MSFLCYLEVEQVESTSHEGRGTWKLLSYLDYESKWYGIIRVPKGYVTDFASVPRIPVLFSLCGDRGNSASTVHDYMYSVSMFTRKTCDDVFREALVDQGVSSWIARTMYWGVRLFGAKHFGKA